MKNLKQSAFTLIELSMVLIIIGLISAAILVGSDLIEAAQTRGTISQIEQLRTAANTFRTKYNCMPGDCKEAVQLDLGGENGDGNGRIDCSGCNNGNGVAEYGNIFLHLKNAELIKDTYVYTSGNFLAIKAKLDATSLIAWYHQTPGVAGINGTDNVEAKTYVAIGSEKWNICNNALGAFTSVCPSITPGVALQMDTKMDDGQPYTGQVTGGGGFRALVYPASISEGNTGNPNACVTTDTSPPSYNAGIRNKTCALLAPFM